MRAALLAIALTAAPASAQAPAFRGDDLYVNPTFNGSSSRVIGLGGSYVPIAEGIDGMTLNIASLANRPRDAASFLQLEPMLSFSEPSSTDRDNDGVGDEGGRDVLVALGLRLQIHKVAFGFFLRGESVLYCADAACERALQIDQADLTVGAATTLLRDQLVLGAAWYRSGGTLHIVELVGGEEVTRARANGLGNGLQLSALVRPEGQPFRVGASLRSPITAPMHVELGDSAAFLNRPIYRGVATPALISAGVAWSFFEGASRLNELSAAGRREYDGVSAEDAEKLGPKPEEPAGRLLLSAQLDVTLPVSQGSGVRAYVQDLPTQAIANAVSVTPRVGLEHLTLVHRLRLRAGSYLEPSVFPGVGPRIHGTGGFDLRLFKLLLDWTLSAHFDVASGYQTIGGTIGVW